MDVKYKQEKGIQYISVTNSVGLKIIFSSLGATICSICWDGIPMTESPLDFHDLARRDIFHGKTCGQIANRVKDGKVIINNKEYQMELNEGSVALHGGPQGLSNQLFGVQRFLTEDSFTIIYTYTKKKNKGYLPGKIDFFVVYSLSENEPFLHVEFRANSSEDTIIALTNHSFFCLGESNIDNLSLCIPSHTFIETNPKTLLPECEKEILPCLDFNKLKPLSKNIKDHYLVNSRTAGYDHDFIFDKERKVTLESPKYRLEIETDFPSVQIYTDNYEDGVRMNNSLEKVRRGVAIEPQESILNRPIILKNQFYTRYINYKFMKK